jgi:hypothetical protein
MSDDQIDDLKQFIQSSDSQLEERLTKLINNKIDTLEDKMNDGFKGVAEAIENYHNDHEVRITKLEETVLSES